jgi:predicted metal-dependent phosphoesterase TrpH
MPPLSRVDLHLHSTLSDGTWTPEQIVAEARRLGMLAISIADHDHLGGVEPAARAAAGSGVEVIAAVEINTDHCDTDVHILGYHIDLAHRALNRELARVREARLERNRRILRRLDALGCAIEERRVIELAGGGSVGRPHIAAALVEAEYVSSQAEAFDRWLARDRPGFVERYRLEPAQAIAYIRKAGGVAVLAHPAKVRNDQLIPALIEQGLRGIEAYHYDHSAAQARHYVTLSEQLDLLITGGSDSHGPDADRPVAMGSVPVPEEVLAPLRQARQPERRR